MFLSLLQSASRCVPDRARACWHVGTLGAPGCGVAKMATRLAHNQVIAGSSPAPAKRCSSSRVGGCHCHVPRMGRAGSNDRRNSLLSPAGRVPRAPRGIFMFLALCLSTQIVAAGAPETVTCHPPNCTVVISADPVGMIPDVPQEHRGGPWRHLFYEDALAVLANAGSPIWQRVRETQDSVSWHVAEVQPLDGETEFPWPPRGAVVFTLRNGIEVSAITVLSTSGRWTEPEKMRIVSLDSGGWFAFDSLRSESLDGQKRVILYLGFPRDRSNLERAKES
jgi:hypothetical protein